MPGNTFHSRIDIWFALSMVGSLAWCAFLAVSLKTEEPVGAGIAVLIGLTLAFVYVSALVPCRYILHSEHLEIQFGRSRQTIVYRDIKKRSCETSFTSAPTLSLRRVRIDYRGGVQYVSPRQREVFVEELQRQVNSTNRIQDAGASACRT